MMSTTINYLIQQDAFQLWKKLEIFWTAKLYSNCDSYTVSKYNLFLSKCWLTLQPKGSKVAPVMLITKAFLRSIVAGLQ